MLIWNRFLEWLNGDSSRKKNLPHWENFIADTQRTIETLSSSNWNKENRDKIREVMDITWTIGGICYWEKERGNLVAYLNVLQSFLQLRGIDIGYSLSQAKKIYELLQEIKKLEGQNTKLLSEKSKMKLKLSEWTEWIEKPKKKSN